LVRCP